MKVFRYGDIVRVVYTNFPPQIFLYRLGDLGIVQYNNVAGDTSRVKVQFLVSKAIYLVPRDHIELIGDDAEFV